MAAGHFLLLAQKKVTKENGTLGSAPLAQRAVRCGRTGFAHRPSMACRRNRRDPSRRPRFARLVRSPFAAAQRGPKSKSKRCVAPMRGFCGRDCRALLFPAPLGRGEQAQEIARRGARRMRARSTRAQGRAPGEPRSLLAQSRGQDARVTADARVSFSWLLLFGQAKRSNRRPWMADDPHTDVSRFSRKRRKPKSKVKNGFRPSPE